MSFRDSLRDLGRDLKMSTRRIDEEALESARELSLEGVRDMVADFVVRNAAAAGITFRNKGPGTPLQVLLRSCTAVWISGGALHFAIKDAPRAKDYAKVWSLHSGRLKRNAAGAAIKSRGTKLRKMLAKKGLLASSLATQPRPYLLLTAGQLNAIWNLMRANRAVRAA